MKIHRKKIIKSISEHVYIEYSGRGQRTCSRVSWVGGADSRLVKKAVATDLKDGVGCSSIKRCAAAAGSSKKVVLNRYNL